MDIVQTIALAGGMAWASGMRLYAVLFAAGLMSRMGYLQLPEMLRVLEHPLVMGAAGVMLVIEFFADKIPAVDSLWDSIHSFIRIPAGALLAAMALGDHSQAVMLAAADSLGDLQETELWIVANGCEESGLVGIARFLESHSFERDTTWFINADNCGAGRVTYTTSEGMLQRCKCDETLCNLAKECAAAEPALEVAGRAFHTMNNDSFLPLRAGHRALSIMAFSEHGVLPNWHWPTDTIENVDSATVECAAELVRRMVRMLDSTIGLSRLPG